MSAPVAEANGDGSNGPPPERASYVFKAPSVWLPPLITVAVLILVMTLVYLGSVINPAGHLHGLPVAIVNEDVGATTGSQHIDLGQEVASGLTHSHAVVSRLSLRAGTLAEMKRRMDVDKEYTTVLHGWSSPGAVLEMVGGVAVLALFFAWERRLSKRPDREPLVDVALFRSRSYTWGVILAAIAIFGMLGVLFTMPQYFQGVLGNTAMGSGLRLLPLIGGLVLAAVSAARMAHLVGAKVTVALGFAILAAGLLIGTHTSVSSSGTFIAGWMAIVGVGMGLAMATSTSAALAELSEEQSGVGSAVLQAINKVPFGTAVLGSVLGSAYLTRLDVSGLPASAASAVRESIFGAVATAHELHSSALLASARMAFVDGMDIALLVAGCVAVLGVVLAAVFLPRASASQAPERTPIAQAPAAIPAG